MAKRKKKFSMALTVFLCIVTLVVGCAIGFIGLIGGIEQGLITIGSGIFFGLILLFVEILCLK